MLAERSEDCGEKKGFEATNVLDSLTAEIAILDNSGVILAVNRAWREFAELNGFPPSSLIEGANYLETCEAAQGPDSEGAQEFAQGIRDVTEGRRIEFIQEYPCHAPNQKRWFLGRVTALRVSVPACVVVAHENITERKLLELELIEAKLAAESADKMKGEFLANMSHEFRTPLNGIIGLTELIMGMEFKPEPREYLQSVLTCADDLLSLFERLLDFSMIEVGSLSLKPIDFDLRDVISAVICPMAARARRKGLKLDLEIDPVTQLNLVGDPSRLGQILVNLVDNAIKFTDRGQVTIRIANDNNAQGPGPVLRFEVIDTGIGIEPDVRERIFRAFEQADGSSRRRYGGVGLGLTLAAKLVDLMGGAIWLDSAPGMGSSFSFSARFGSRVDAATNLGVQMEPV